MSPAERADAYPVVVLEERPARAAARDVVISRVVEIPRLPLLAFLVSRAIVWLSAAAGALSGRMHDVAYPPSFGWLGNLLTASGARWDAAHYLGIAAHGYSAADQTVFFPLYPFMIRVVGWMTRSEVGAGMLISSGAFLVSLVLLHRLTDLELGRRAADTTVWLLALAPLSFFFSAIYTESLFLALAIGAIYAARQARWAWAGGLVALATLTRLPGILVSVPVALLYLRAHRRPKPDVAWLLLAPAALIGFLGCLAYAGYGWLAPMTNETIPEYGRKPSGPIETVAQAVHAAISGARATLRGLSPYQPSHLGPFTPQFQSVILLIVLGIGVLALLVALKRLPIELTIYSLLAILLTVDSQTGSQPLYSSDRYLLSIFPLWMAAGAWLSERQLRKPVLGMGAAALAFYSFQFATGAFIA